MQEIALFGTVFIDIKGFSKNKYDPVGRNVGNVQFIHGGVGRNVAEDMGVLGRPVTFVSTVDDTAMGIDVEKRLWEYNINTEYLKKVEQNGMGMFMAILDNNGDLAGSISSPPDFIFFETLLEEKCEEIIKRSSHVALEIDLNQKISRKIVDTANRLKKPIYGLPGNLSVILADKDILMGMECFICNDIEAEKIFDCSFGNDDLDLIKAEVENFANKMEIKSMIVTMGEKGAVYYQKSMAEAVYHKVNPVKMIDSTGAGDSFFSGVVSALVQNKPLEEAVKFGSEVAAYTIQSAESTCVGFKLK